MSVATAGGQQHVTDMRGICWRRRNSHARHASRALYELMEQEEEQKLLEGTFSAAPTDGGLAWTPEQGLYNPENQPRSSNSSQKRPKTDNMSPLTEEEQLKWALDASMNGNQPANSPTVSPLTPNQHHLQPSISSTSSNPLTNVSSLPSPQSTHPALGTQNQPIEIDEEEDEPAPKLQTSPIKSPVVDLSEPFNPDQWTCQVCTCINPVRFLACDACATERPQPSTATSRRPTPNPNIPRWTAPPSAQTQSLGWNCTRCQTFMEHKWWTCSACGLMKGSS